MEAREGRDASTSDHAALLVAVERYNDRKWKEEERLVKNLQSVHRFAFVFRLNSILTPAQRPRDLNEVITSARCRRPLERVGYTGRGVRDCHPGIFKQYFLTSFSFPSSVYPLISFDLQLGENRACVGGGNNGDGR